MQHPPTTRNANCPDLIAEHCILMSSYQIVLHKDVQFLYVSKKQVLHTFADLKCHCCLEDT